MKGMLSRVGLNELLGGAIHGSLVFIITALVCRENLANCK
jgi:hypothetical protein